MPRKLLLAFRVIVLMLALTGCQTPVIDSEPADVSLNHLSLNAPAQQSFRFLVIGHAYGSVEIDDRLPAKQLLEKIDELNNANLSMLISLGDMVMHSQPEEFDLLDQKLLSKLSLPVFNVPGNHDVEDRALYESRYGQTYYTFSYGPARFIFLDTEIKSCQINTAQQELLANALKAGLRDRDTQYIFIFMHKTLFFRNDFLFESQKHWAMPNVWTCYNNTNFNRIMDEKILPAARKKPIYLFAGDVGAWGNLSPYFEKSKDLPLTMVMTGLGDTSSDSGILVEVNDRNVRLEVFPLSGQDMPSLESFNADYWNQSAKQEGPKQ